MCNAPVFGGFVRSALEPAWSSRDKSSEHNKYMVQRDKHVENIMQVYLRVVGLPARVSCEDPHMRSQKVTNTLGNSGEPRHRSGSSQGKDTRTFKTEKTSFCTPYIVNKVNDDMALGAAWRTPTL